jgi:Holliday junction resolvasome RuvABC DNA-binding subunit
LDCPCGKKTRIEPVCHVEVTYATKTTEQFDKSGENPSLATPELPIDDFVSTLAGLGYKKADARKLVLAHADDYDGDEGKFITFLIQQGASA